MRLSRRHIRSSRQTDSRISSSWEWRSKGALSAADAAEFASLSRAILWGTTAPDRHANGRIHRSMSLATCLHDERFIDPFDSTANRQASGPDLPSDTTLRTPERGIDVLRRAKNLPQWCLAFDPRNREAGNRMGAQRRVSARPGPRVRVLVADDDPAFRTALEYLLSNTPGVELVAAASDAEAAIRDACRLLPDVAILDVAMPHGGGPRAAREILLCSPRTRLLAHSVYRDVESVRAMADAGCAIYLVKGLSAMEDLVNAILRPAAGTV